MVLQRSNALSIFSHLYVLEHWGMEVGVLEWSAVNAAGVLVGLPTMKHTYMCPFWALTHLVDK